MQPRRANPNPGRVALHRLNRAEYANAIEDLLGVRIDASALLPKDDEADGFDNVASVLTVSPSFLDQYISAARVVTARALGNPAARPGSMTYRPARGTDQAVRVEGLPLGTRGGLIVEHLFPADGDYKFNINGLAAAGYVRGMEYRHTLIVTIDGVKVFQGADRRRGRHQGDRSAAGARGRGHQRPLPEHSGEGDRGAAQGWRHVHRPHVRGVGRGAVLVPARRRRGADSACRQPRDPGPVHGGGTERHAEPSADLRLPPEDRGRGTARARRTSSRRSRGAPSVVRSPIRICRRRWPSTRAREGRGRASTPASRPRCRRFWPARSSCIAPSARRPARRAGTVHRITALDLASRLSFFLLGHPPDDELLRLAEKGALADPKTLDAQVRRLLADPRSSSLVTNFAFQWLKMRGLDEVEPDAIVFPNFDDGLREGFRKEMAMFVESIIREDRSVLDLLTADYTFVNERLALHYGIPNVRGDQFRRVTLADQNRWGLLGKGGVLLSTSYANRTAPVHPRRVDSREHSRHAAGGAAAGRRGVPGKQGRREGQDHPRDHGAAPRQADVQRLPRRDGSAGLRARELRRHRRVALAGPLGRHSHRRVGRSSIDGTMVSGPADLRKALRQARPRSSCRH